MLVLAIALVIAIGTGIYSGLGSMENWRIASNDASFEALDAHDLEVSLTEGTFAREGELDRLVALDPGRRLASSRSRSGSSPRPRSRSSGPVSRRCWSPARWSARRSGRGGPAVDGVVADRGRALTAADAGAPVAVLEPTFADYHDLPADGQDLRSPAASGSATSASGPRRSTSSSRGPGGGEFGGAEASFAVVFTSLETAQRTTIGRQAVNDVVLTLGRAPTPRRSGTSSTRASPRAT